MVKHIILGSGLARTVSNCAKNLQTFFIHDGIMDIVFQEDFFPISYTDLPVAIKETIRKFYGDYNIENVFKNDLKEYKLELHLDERKEIMYCDQRGHWINKK